MDSKASLQIIAVFSLFELLLHLYSNAFANYGIIRDEFYYVACSNHLAAGYVDQPPLSSFILFFSIKLFGDSIFSLRLLPAVASAGTVFVTGQMTRKLKGGSLAVFLSCLSISLAPQFIGINTIYSMNAFDWMFWALAAYMVILIIQSDLNSTRNKKNWLWLGIILGLGILNKIDLLWFGCGLLVGLLITPQRKFLKTRWPYLAGIIAFIMFSPYIVWNITHNFATLEFMRRASTLKYASQNPITLISGMLTDMNPVAVPVWLSGIYFLLFHKDGKDFRLIGYIFAVTFLLLIINWHTKTEYIAPAFPMLLAAGGVMIELIAKRKAFAWIKYVLPSIIFLSGVILIPFALPVLPADSYIKYTRSLGMAPSTAEGHKLSGLPQYYADMFGWENMARTVSKVYSSLPLDEQKTAVVFGNNYGEAGAIDYYRKDYYLPRAISGHNNYWFWGLEDTSFKTIIVIGGKKEDLFESFDSVEQAAVIKSDYAIQYENNLPVYICRRLKLPIKVIWNEVRRFI
jgi:Dolichyl-phosphate-mannose-protein mannosyltransferase